MALTPLTAVDGTHLIGVDIQKGGSMLLPLNINVNRGGIPALRSTAVSVSTTDVRFDFNSHPNVGEPFVGLIVVSLAQAIPTGTTGTLPIVFTTSGGNPANVTTVNGENITASDITGTGVYIMWVETQSGVVQLLAGGFGA